jgi:hypothetical protein
MSHPDQAPAQRSTDIVAQLLRGRTRGAVKGAHDDPPPVRDIHQQRGEDVAQPALDAIPHHGTTNGSTNDESCAGRCIMALDAAITHERTHVDDHSRGAGAGRPAHHRAELLSPPDPAVTGQHGTVGCRYADRRARPFPRRDASTERPARVLMRVRNPCVRARRRLFGWNVRFMRVSSSGSTVAGEACVLGLVRLAGQTPS